MATFHAIASCGKTGTVAVRLAEAVADTAKRTRKRTIAMDGLQFIERLLMHVLPAGFKRNPPGCRGDAQAFMRRVAVIEIV